jgi:hypothetical protein
MEDETHERSISHAASQSPKIRDFKNKASAVDGKKASSRGQQDSPPLHRSFWLLFWDWYAIL